MSDSAPDPNKQQEPFGYADDEPSPPSGAVDQSDIDVLLEAAADSGEGAADAQTDDMTAAQPAPSAPSEAPQAGPDMRQFDPPDLGSDGVVATDSESHRVTMLSDVNLNVRIELGRTRMLVEDVLALGEGSVVELDKIAGDPVDVYVNDRLVARGEILVLNDNFCVRVSDVLSRDPHRVVT